MDTPTEFRTQATVLKVSEELGIIYGFAVVCTEDGEPYFDLGETDADGINRPDHIPESTMMKSATALAKSARIATEMHARDEDGSPIRSGAVVHTFPLTQEIADALEITTKRTGLLVGVQPEDPEVIEKAKAGKFGGFSIGGRRVKDRDVD